MMTPAGNRDRARKRPQGRPAGPFERLRLSRDGAAAIEFAILALPFFLIVFAIIETFVAYAGEQLLENSVDTLAREIRTGEITYAQGRSSDETADQFRTALCNEISIMMRCAASGAADQNLYINVQQFNPATAIPTTVPMKNGDLDTTGFGFAPGKAQTYNMVRAYYRWPIIVDLVRPYLANVGKDGPHGGDYLMVATSIFKNENYP
ncbi:MAG: TadE/TadG family type IV pilus assembly protein [Pararhizobium sp.]